MKLNSKKQTTKRKFDSFLNLLLVIWSSGIHATKSQNLYSVWESNFREAILNIQFDASHREYKYKSTEHQKNISFQKQNSVAIHYQLGTLASMMVIIPKWIKI